MATDNKGFTLEENKKENSHVDLHTNDQGNQAFPDMVNLQMENNSRKKLEEIEIDSLSHPKGNLVAVGIETFWTSFHNCRKENQQKIKKVLTLLVLLVLILYVGAVIHQFRLNGPQDIDWCRGYGLAFILFGLITWSLFYYKVALPYLFPCFFKCCNFDSSLSTKLSKIKCVIAILFATLLIAFIIWDTSSDRRRLLSFGGLMTFVALGFIFSKHPTLVKWNTVYMGLAIQFIMGLVAIRWNGGRQVFKCIGSLAQEFLEYAYVGATLVFGERNVRQDAVFAFQALSAIFFVSMIVQVLFYLGWMQKICLKLGWFIQVALGTTVMESVNAVSSVFLGMTEAPLLYKPYIKDLTTSEMHAVMAGGFSTIAGTVFAAFASFGVNPANIITASIMTAPAALCYSKLVYPEDSVSKTDSKTVQIYKSDDKGIMDAAIQGALIGINMVQGIIASVIACVSIIALFNDITAWLGMLVGLEDFTIETIFSYIFYPAVWLMGVEPSQCLSIARLVGIKVTVNEFIAYKQLGELKKTGVLSPRTEAIATYALCSFANPGSVGIMISTLTTLAPSQRFNVVAVSIRAFMSAIVISFLTACIAGTLMPEEGYTD